MMRKGVSLHPSMVRKESAPMPMCVQSSVVAGDVPLGIKMDQLALHQNPPLPVRRVVVGLAARTIPFFSGPPCH